MGKQFSVEVLECENGYVIFDGAPYGRSGTEERKRWVAVNEQNLGQVIEALAKESKLEQNAYKSQKEGPKCT